MRQSAYFTGTPQYKQFMPESSQSIFEPGSRVERCNSPRDSLVKDGAVGHVIQIIPAENGEAGYWVRFEDGTPARALREPVFCAATRLKAASE
jgi:hypothetical protein